MECCNPYTTKRAQDEFEGETDEDDLGHELYRSRLEVEEADECLDDEWE